MDFLVVSVISAENNKQITCSPGPHRAMDIGIICFYELMQIETGLFEVKSRPHGQVEKKSFVKPFNPVDQNSFFVVFCFL